MIEHKHLGEESHQILIRPNPSMPWAQLKMIYTIFACFILSLASDRQIPKNKLI